MNDTNTKLASLTLYELIELAQNLTDDPAAIDYHFACRVAARIVMRGGRVPSELSSWINHYPTELIRVTP